MPRWLIELLRAADDGAGGGAAAGDGASAAGGLTDLPALAAAARDAAKGDAGKADPPKEASKSDPAAGDGQKAPEGQPYFPEGLDAKLKGATERETLDNIAKHFAEQPKAPDTVEGYKLDLSDALKAKYGDMSNDPVVPIYRTAAHKWGLTNEQFNGVMGDIYAGMVEKGLLDAPVDVAKQLEALMPASGDPKQREAAATERVNKALDFVEALATRGMPTAEASKLAQIAETADGVRALEYIGKLLQDKGMSPGGAPPGDGLSDNERVLRQLYPSMFKGAA